MMSIKFVFRGKNNYFVKSNDWDNIFKVNLISSELDKKVINKVNVWFNVNPEDLKLKTSRIQNVIIRMMNDKRSDNFISRFLKSYVSSSVSKFDPIKVYESMLANGIADNKYWN